MSASSQYLLGETDPATGRPASRIPEQDGATPATLTDDPHDLTVDAEKAVTAELIAKIARREDRPAFIEIYTHFAPRVKSFLIGKGLQPAAADDVLQEVMLSVWQKSHLYDPTKSAVNTWIFTIARNKYIDRLRREQHHTSKPDEPDLRPADIPDSAVEASLAERKNGVHAALTKLPPEQRDVIVLSFMKGLAHGEIAARLDLPLGTVKSRIRATLKHLRKEEMALQHLA